MGNTGTFRRVAVGTVAMLLLASMVGATASAATDHAVMQQSNATTTTATQSGAAETTETCVPDDSAPELEVARLSTDDPVIEKGSPGTVTGSFVPDATSNCELKVQVIMLVPSGMSISGFSDASGMEGQTMTKIFTVDPEKGATGLRADVYSQYTGEKSVTADIQYWPAGHEDMAREIDGISLNFDVQEAVTQDPTPGNDTGATGGGGDEPIVNPLVLAIGGLILVGGVLAVGTARSKQFDFAFSFGKN